MYVLLFLLVPVLYLFNTRLSLGALVVAIVAMYIARTRPDRESVPRSRSDSRYSPGWED
jgi:hypothetical protein